MSIVVPFKGKAELAATENLRAFLSHARLHTPFVGVAWEEDAWNITAWVTRRARGSSESWAHFSSLRDTRSRRDKADFLRQPFKDFAKAAFSEFFRRSKPREFQRYIYTLRAVEQALVEQGGVACVTQLTSSTLDRAAEILATRIKNPWSHGLCLVHLAEKIINPAGLAGVVIYWTSPFKWQNAIRNDAVYNDDRASNRLPDVGALVALGEIHSASPIPQDRVITSFCAIALFGPSRVSEILSLPVNCIVSVQSGEHEVLGLSCEPAKGADPLTRFGVCPDSDAIAEESVGYLVQLGRPARTAARWYAANPGQLYLPSGFDHLRDKPITLWEASKILGMDHTPRACDAISKLKWRSVPNKRTTDRSRFQSNSHWVGLFDFSSIEQFALARLPAAFPVLDSQSKLYWHDALFVLPFNSLIETASSFQHIPQAISVHMVNNHLNSMPSGRTIFKRNGKLDLNGEPYRLASHSIRHLLNTIAQSRHLSQALIAFWSGRKSVSQNAWYDHVPQETYIEAYRLLGKGAPQLNAVGPLAEKAKSVAARSNLSYEAALKVEVGAIQVTRYGICRHDYSLTPCPKDKDCVSCGEHAVAKGDDGHLKMAILQRDLYRRASALASSAVQRGEPGAEVWLRRNEERLQRWELIVERLENPSIPDRTLISLPPPTHSETRSDRAMKNASRPRFRNVIQGLRNLPTEPS